MMASWGPAGGLWAQAPAAEQHVHTKATAIPAIRHPPLGKGAVPKRGVIALRFIGGILRWAGDEGTPPTPGVFGKERASYRKQRASGAGNGKEAASC
jgi:hypothetical protein